MGMKKYEIGTKENRAFLREICMGLLEFGRNFPAPGGSAYYLKEDGKPWTEKNREVYETCRMAHVYAIGEFLGFSGGKELAEKAVGSLMGEMRDKENGGWYAGLDPEGKPLPSKLCYAHAFVILGASSAALVGVDGAEELLREAIQVYDRYFWNEEEGLSCDTWNTEFTVLDDYRGLNANMHTVEAFLAAADVLEDETYRERAGRIIRNVVGWAENNNWRIPEHYTKEWAPELDCNKERPDDPFKPYGATPGHGLEWGRLILQWALSAAPADKEIYIEAAKNLYHRAISDGWNADGAPGVVYTTDWDGKPVVHDRMHWTLAEAINTAAVLYRVTGEERYAKDYADFMKYLDETVLDHENGSWFHQLDRENRLAGTVWPGKPDVYHALQAVLIPYYVPEVSIALAVKRGQEIEKGSAK